MKRHLLYLFAFLLCRSALADLPTFLTLIYQDDHVQIPFSHVDAALINDLCFQNLTKCMAFQNFRNPSKSKSVVGDWKNYSSPAAAYCAYIEGVPLILKDDGERQIGICAFSDKSMISSWDLYTAYKKASR